AAALKERGVVLTVGPALSKEAQPGVYLAAGHVQGGKALGEFLSGARDKGLFPFALSDAIPGPGRGFFTAVFGVRGYEEHGIALVGGDAAGLERTVDVFIDWLRTEPRRLSFPENPEPVYTIQGKASAVAAVPRLSEMAGVRLSEVLAAPDGKHLVLAADGYHRNLALIAGEGSRATVLRPPPSRRA